MTLKDREKKVKEEFLKELGNHIKLIRIEKNISGAELSRLLFMEKPNITRLEKGRVNPSIYLIKQICDVLEISMDDFWKKFNKK